MPVIRNLNPAFCRQFYRITSRLLRSHQNDVTVGHRVPLLLVPYCTTSDEPPLSRYPVPDRKSLDPDIQQVMNEVEEKGGFLPNVFSALSHRPDEFRAFFQYYDVLMNKESGTLSKAEKEMIIVATSAYNNCLYCVVAHGALHRIYSKRPLVADQLATNWQCADLSPREYAIVEFAMKICKSEHISEEDFVPLEKQGMTREDAWDIGAISAFFALSNRMAHLSAMRPNKEFFTMGRLPKEKKQ